METIAELGQLKRFDTPTVCNALEMIDPRRRSFGYTKYKMNCINKEVGPIVGFAATATMRSYGSSLKTSKITKEHRLEYYKYIHDISDPKVVIMQDLDGDDRGVGPFWGEFNTRIHRALGCVGIVTDGSVRDVTHLPDDVLILSDGLRPSHAHVHIVDFSEQVNVFGMYARSGDIIHADVHGAVSFDKELVSEVIVCADKFVKSEVDIIEACKKETVSFEELAELYMKR